MQKYLEYLTRLTGCWDSALIVWIGFGLSIGLMYLYHEKLLKKDDLTLTSWQKVLCRIGVLLPVALMAALRAQDVGADTAKMWNDYLECRNTTFWGALNYEYTAVLFYTARWVVCQLSFGSVQVYFFVMAAVSLYCVVAGIEKWNLKHSATALFVFYSCFGLILMNQSRQMIAVCILLYAYDYAYHGNWKKYIPFVLVAGLIHLSALFCGVLIYLVQPRNENSWKNIITLIAIAVSLVAMQWLLELAGLLVKGTFYYDYIKAMRYYIGRGVGPGLLVTLIPTVLPVCLFQRYLDKERRLRNTTLVTLVARYMSYFSYFLYRLFYYFGCVNVIALPLAMERCDKAGRRMVTAIVYGLCIVYFLLNFCIAYAKVYFPYHTIFM